MMNLAHYLNDGANWQAQAVLAYVRGNLSTITEQTWNSNGHGYDLTVEVGRYENGRCQGYVFSILIRGFMSKAGSLVNRNWAVYEHQNSDQICVITSDTFTTNTPRWEEMGGRSKYDTDKTFECGDIAGCGNYLVAEMADFIAKNYQKASV